jgi:single-strand DNA-binding protein
MMNSIQLVGRAGGDAEIRYFENGRHKATFRMAVDRGVKKKGADEWASDWFTVEVWSNAAAGDYQTLAEKAAEKVKKGDVVAVKGQLHLDDYTDRDGVERIRVTVQADWFRVVAKKGDGHGAISSHGQAPTYGIGHVKAQPPADWQSDEIPF